MIKQFDMKFGDCFLLEKESENPWLIDFGSKTGYRSKVVKVRYDKVIECLQSIGNHKVTFLLSHFHEDHYSGLLYMKKLKKTNFKFKQIIVPDIRNKSVAYSMISSLFYKTFLESISLGRKSSKMFSNLFDITQYFLDYASDLKFVSRGETIDDKVILWPLKNSEANENYEIFQIYLKELNIFPLEEIDRLNTYVENCADAWYKMLTIDQKRQYELQNEVYDMKIAFIGLDSALTECLHNEIYMSMDTETEVFKCLYQEIIKRNHEYNIVFHNSNNNIKNYLFTGDIEKRNMTKIYNNSIYPSINLYKTYRYIKIPHHGTKNYFFDFSAKTNKNTILLISNGKYSNWKIYSEYYDKYPNIMHICSNCNHCETFKENANTCKCKKYKIVFPGLSINA